MDTQKEIELFEELLLANPDFDESLLAKDEDGYYEDCEIGDQLGIFQAGIEVAEREARMNAKAQTVPEGFVLVPKKPTEKMLKAIYDNKNSTANAYKAMIEAQEQSHD